jgi:hypothetical protein
VSSVQILTHIIPKHGSYDQSTCDTILHPPYRYNWSVRSHTSCVNSPNDTSNTHPYFHNSLNQSYSTCGRGSHLALQAFKWGLFTFTSAPIQLQTIKMRRSLTLFLQICIGGKPFDVCIACFLKFKTLKCGQWQRKSWARLA